MTAHSSIKAAAILSLIKSDTAHAAFSVSPRGLIVDAEFTVSLAGDEESFGAGHVVETGEMIAGSDYSIVFEDGVLKAIADGTAIDASEHIIGGFHFAPGGNASARAGGDSVPAINRHSIWDLGFRPACTDPRGMVLIDGRWWCDIYLLGVDHNTMGTSRHGVTIADDRDRPKRLGGEGRHGDLNYHTAVAIYAGHGKQLLSVIERFEAAYGVTEKTAIGIDPKVTGLDAARTSKWGLMQAAGSMWEWGHDGDPDEPRACLFGGSWLFDGVAGSRRAFVDLWPGVSFSRYGARGRSDHLVLA